jgi:diguanylate cyclase (GGDEF)-like protein/PAS domain S-box-containing protein
MRLTLAQRMILVFALLGALGCTALYLAAEVFASYGELAQTVNHSGRLRMLSQKIVFSAYRTLEGRHGAREQLRGLIDEFEHDLGRLEGRAPLLGLSWDGTALALRNLKQEWHDYRQAAQVVLGQDEAAARTAFEYLENSSEVMLFSAEETVRQILDFHARERRTLQLFVFIALALGLTVAAAAYRFIQTRVVQPVRLLGDMGRRFAAGELTARVDYRARDEIGDLVETLNHTADSTQQLIQRISRNEQKLEETEQKFRSLVEESLAGVYLIREDGLIEYTNPRMAAIFGYRPEELLDQRTIFDLVSPRFRALVRERIQLRLAGIELQARYEFSGLRRDGSELDIEVYGTRITLGGRQAIIGTLLDVTERKRHEAQLVYHAHHDALTGLPNRNLLLDRLRQAIAAAQRYHRIMAVLFVDLDHFKFVNDSLGHGAGDALLRLASMRLQECVRENDTVARLGGDEFVLLLTDVEREEGVALIAERVLQSLARPFPLGGDEAFVGCSIGASLYPRDSQDGEGLLRCADIAMYRAKEGGRNDFQFYTQEMQTRFSERMTLETSLRRALERDEFRLHYQPQIEVATGRVVGAEALIRWVHPEQGLISPAQFIPLAEETGLIVPIGEWVLDEACSQSRQWRAAGLEVPGVAVNLSARQFRQKNLVQLVEQALRLHGLDAMNLELELTESLVMHDPDQAIAILRRLKEIGVRLALDDFGTGYSSLSHLRRFPIDELKIDQSFIRDIAASPDDAAITAAMVSLAHGLKLTVVAEGVETTEQLKFLRRHQCDRVQGYLFSRPLPAPDFALLLERGVAAGNPHVGGRLCAM